MPWIGDDYTPVDEDGFFVWQVNSYDAKAPTPEVGSRWVWEPSHPTAREDIVVDDVRWNGEEWWIATTGDRSGRCLNDVSRFWEACEPAGR